MLKLFPSTMQYFYLASDRFYTSQKIETVRWNTWEKVLAENIERAKLQEGIILLGDGRMDSPGFCAKFCMYVGMDAESNDIFALEIIDKSQVSLKSTAMEKKGLVDLLKLVNEKLKITEVVTDSHSQIIKFMREKHPDKVHCNDIWHGAKKFV